MASITSLPIETICQLPRDLYHLDDFLALDSTCRHLHLALHACAPGDLLALCYRSRTTFFRPNPHFLLAALIPAIRQYACSSETRRVEVKRAIWHGCEGLLEWACSTPEIAIYAHWSTRSIHELWERRMRVLNPLSDLVDRCVGQQWYSTPDFWSSVEDAYTIQAEPEKQVFEMQMYGDMFGPLMEGCLGPEPVDTPALGIAFRLDFVKYLLPDGNVNVHVSDLEYWPHEDVPSARTPSPTDYFVSNDLPTTAAGDSRVHPLRAVQTVFGPYSGDLQGESQTTLLHLLKRSPLWETLVNTLRAQCGPDFWVPPQHEPEMLEGLDLPGELDVDPSAESDSEDEADIVNDEADDPGFDQDDDDVIDGEESAINALPSPVSPGAPEWWRQDLWAACPYALGGEFLEMMAQVWRVRGADEVALLELRRQAFMQARRRALAPEGAPDSWEGEEGAKEGPPYDAAGHTELLAQAKADRAHPGLAETGAGWATLRRWHATIAALEHEPVRMRVSASDTHEGYPDFVGDMLVATRQW